MYVINKSTYLYLFIEYFLSVIVLTSVLTYSFNSLDL